VNLKGSKLCWTQTKTICVVKHDGKEVGRIPATADNASAYMEELAKHYGGVQVEYEQNEDAGLLALLHSRPKH